MPTTYSLDDLKHYHNEATQFFAAELMFLKEVVPKIGDERIAKTATLLLSCGQTGAALLQLANQTDRFTSESVMLARSFMEKMTNFCYASICDEKEYRAFVLHPIYKHYHSIGNPKMEDNFDYSPKKTIERKKKQEKLKRVAIVQEALTMFSETKDHLPWTKKTLSQRIAVIEKWGKLMDVFFTLSRIEYYSDASEALHGSLYGCMYNVGIFEIDYKNTEEINKKLYKDSTCILLHLGMLIHESFTLISHSSDIKEIWKYSYKNRGKALNLLFHVLERKIPKKKN